MDPAALDAGGIKLACTIFRVDDSLPAASWAVAPVGGQRRIVTSPLTAVIVDVERDRDITPARELLITVSPDLRDTLKDIIGGIEADERRERIERGEEEPEPERLHLSGTVRLGDDDGAPHIGDVEVLAAVGEKFGRGEPLVEVYLGAEREAATTFAGPVEADEGWPGTDVTPGDLPKIEVGTFDLLGKLRDLEGRHVELVVRGVERPPAFFIEVDPRQQRRTWLVPDPRFSGQDRIIDDLNAEAVIGLIDAESPARRIIVSFDPDSAEAVDRLRGGYKRIEQESGRVLPAIEVVPGKGEGHPAASFYESLDKTNRVDGPHFIAGVVRMGFGLTGIDTAEELAAAQRGLDAHRDGKLLLVVEPELLDRTLVHRDAITFHGEDAERFAVAGTEARKARQTKAEGTEPPDDVVYFFGGPGEGMSFRYAPHYNDGQWGCDYQPLRQGGLSSHSLAELLTNGGRHFAFARDLVPYAMILLMAMKKTPRRDWAEWVRELFGPEAEAGLPASVVEDTALAVANEILGAEGDK